MSRVGLAVGDNWEQSVVLQLDDGRTVTLAADELARLYLGEEARRERFRQPRTFVEPDDGLDATWNYETGYQEAALRFGDAFAIDPNDWDTEGDAVDLLLELLPRAEVRAFAAEMERQLRENDHKGGWKNADLRFLSWRLMEEHAELAAEIEDRLQEGASNHETLLAEAADCANFAMMIFDVVRASAASGVSSEEAGADD